MSDSYDRYNSEAHTGGFMMGLLTGTVLGAGIGMLLAPKSGSDLRGQLGEQAKNFGNRASEQYRRASETANTWAERGRDMVNQAKSAVQKGAEEAQGYTGTSTGSYSSGSTGSYSGGSSSTPGSGSYGGGTSGSDFGRS
jgi:gas vesicle protein